MHATNRISSLDLYSTGQGVGGQGNEVTTDRRQCRSCADSQKAKHACVGHTRSIPTGTHRQPWQLEIRSKDVSFTRHTCTVRLQIVEMPHVNVLMGTEDSEKLHCD